MGPSGVRSDRKYSYRKLESVAGGVRECLGIGLRESLNALRLFEDLDDISVTLRDGAVIPFRSGVVSLEDSEGYTRYDKGRRVIEVLASELTYQWLETGHPRASYFVAHELGHCVLHTDQLVRLAQLPTQQQAAYHRGRADHAAYEDTEWQANAFASALLMPARGIQMLENIYGCVTPSMIVHKFAVSLEAARYRLDLYEARGEQLLG